MINSKYTDQSPFLSADQCTLYFTSNRPEPGETDVAGDQNIWVSKRKSRHDDWETPQLVTKLNTPSNELGAKMTIDGLVVFFFSNRAGSIPDSTGAPSTDIYMSRRWNPRDDQGWGPPTRVDGVSTPDAENAPMYWAGRLYFGRGLQGPGSSDIYVAGVTRQGVVYDDPKPVTELNSTNSAIGVNDGNDASPVIRIDGREIYFWRGTTSLTHIYTSTRKSVFDKWSDPVYVEALNVSGASSATCFLSFDAKTMILDSSRAGSRDLWISTRTIGFVAPSGVEED